ncbi:high mobility group B protein 7-like isoform X3 [Euphorbia lathyris]|uniref:high mobility group B protein 7-like isoform X3 n=1 Tax=Euphorbia lathyris TaxID=212925 RepID=UPI0033139A82
MARKRVEAESEATAPAETPTTTTKILVRSKDGSAFARCEECKKNVPVALINMHSCSLDARIKMNLEAQVVETATEVKKKSAERKKPTSTAPKSKRAKKDPSKPKRPPTAFFIFMLQRKQAKSGNLCLMTRRSNTMIKLLSLRLSITKVWKQTMLKTKMMKEVPGKMMLVLMLTMKQKK